MSNVIGIFPSGVSNQTMRDQLLRQLDANQTQMSQLETEISSGYQFQLPSQNPQAAMQVEGIQSMLERTTQLQTNIGTNQNYLSQTDSTLSGVSSLLTSIQSAALSAVGSTANASERQAVVQQIDQAVQQMVTLGNTQFNGQQLFGGTNSATPPFSIDAAGNVVYSGGAEPAQSYSDLNQLFPTGVTGAQAFGAISQPVEGASLSPAITLNTPLSTLNDGKGVAEGSIVVSDGQNTATINLSGAKTLGDVATLIERGFDQVLPKGQTIAVALAPSNPNDPTSPLGLSLQLVPGQAGDNLSVQEVDGGSTAGDLGILNVKGTGSGQLIGQPLTATITPNTPLNSLFGTQAQANIHFGVPNSDIVLQANTPGASFNNVTVTFNNNAPSAGQESAGFDAATNTLSVSISTSPTAASRASQIVTAINDAGLPFTASLDPADQNGGGQPPITTLPADTTTAGGSGIAFDTSGLQIVSGGKTYTIDVSGDSTVQDLLNSIKNSGAGLDAEVNSAQTGINVSSRVSGADFSIGENGGNTAAQLGLRTFNANTQLSQLNYGAGVGVNSVAAGGTDFTIREMIPAVSTTAAVHIPVSIAGDSTVGDVINSINVAAQAAGATVRAQLATAGNGIELTDAVNGPIVVIASSQSSAAVDLGLVPKGQTSATSATVTTASGSEASGPNSELLFHAVNPGSSGDASVVFQANAGITEGNETVQYDPTTNTLTFQIAPQTTANDIIAALKKNTAINAEFTASLDTSNDPSNDGTGTIQPQTIQMSGGQEDVLTGTDTNPQQTESVFNALRKLGTALQNNNNVAIQQAMTLLSNSMQNLGNARDELGVQEQALSTTNTQLGNQQLNLQSAMSTNYDTNMASAIADYTSEQIAYQATLQTTASIMKMTLLNYL